MAACNPSSLQTAQTLRQLEELQDAMTKESPPGSKALERIAHLISDLSVEVLNQRLPLLQSFLSVAMTPLGFSVERGKVEVVELLLKRGIDLNAAMLDGGTPLEKAILAVGSAMIRLRPVAGLPYPGFLGEKGELESKVERSFNMVKFLLQNGADPKTRNLYGRTLLHQAVTIISLRDSDNAMARKVWLELIDQLLMAGVDPSICDRRGSTCEKEVQDALLHAERFLGKDAPICEAFRQASRKFLLSTLPKAFERLMPRELVELICDFAVGPSKTPTRGS